MNWHRTDLGVPPMPEVQVSSRPAGAISSAAVLEQTWLTAEEVVETDGKIPEAAVDSAAGAGEARRVGAGAALRLVDEVVTSIAAAAAGVAVGASGAGVAGVAAGVDLMDAVGAVGGAGAVGDLAGGAVDGAARATQGTASASATRRTNRGRQLPRAALVAPGQG